ncbi:MAG: hypothetical protein ACC628_27990, partial [Pirellulaceae bacterium]
IGAPGVVQPPLVQRPHATVPFLASAGFDATLVAEEIEQAIEAASAPALVIPVKEGDQIFDGDFEVVDDNGDLYMFEWNDVTRLQVPAGATPIPPNMPDPNISCTNPIPNAVACIPVPFVGGGQYVVGTTTTTINPSTAFQNMNALLNAIRNNVQVVTATQGFGNAPTVIPTESVIVSLYNLEATAEAVGDKVIVNGIQPGSNQIFVPGTANITKLNVDRLIRTQEFLITPDATGNPIDQSADKIARDVAAGVSAHPDYTAGGAFDRINFQGARTADFSGVQVDGQLLWTRIGSAPGVAPGNERVELLASDTGADRQVVLPNGVTVIIPGVATKIATEINNVLSPRISAFAFQDEVRLDRGRTFADPPLQTAGEGPGGMITGLASLGGRLYAVSDNGGLYIVNIPQSELLYPFDSSVGAGAVTVTYVDNSAADLEGIDFAGLTTGPPSVEGGRYGNLLFAVDSNGQLYAFDAPIRGREATTGGELQPIFLDGATSANTGLINATGLAFSTLDQNLFQITPESSILNNCERQQDPGHGINESFDLARPENAPSNRRFPEY